MNRRALLSGLAGLGLVSLGGCSVLPEAPYQQRREWPLNVRQSTARPARIRGRVLLVRTMSAAPGLEVRGLQWLLPDGSVHVDFYEQWAVPPAQAVEAALQQWLAESGLFAAVVGPGSRMQADLVLEPELIMLIADPARHMARAAIALVLLRQQAARNTVLLQQTVSADVVLARDDVPATVTAQRAAVEQVLSETELHLRRFA